MVLLYSTRTGCSAPRVDLAESKSTGLARYHRTRHVDDFMQHLSDLDGDSDSRPERGLLDTRTVLMRTAKHFYRLFVAPPRRLERPRAPTELDLAASAQSRPREG